MSGQENTMTHDQETTTEPPERGFAAALWPGLWLAGMLAALAFAISFVALRDVGRSIGIETSIAWMFPVIIDGFIVLATWAVWRFKAAGLRASWYPGLALVAFSAVSLTGNALHAHPVATGGLLLTRWAAAAFSTVPPLALLAASHMLVMIVTHRTDHEPAATTEPSVTDALLARPSGPLTVTAHEPAAHVAAARITGDRSVTGRSRAADRAALTADAAHGERPLAGAHHDDHRAVTAEVRAPSARPARSAVRSDDHDLAGWVSARVAAGQAVSGPEAVTAGVVASESTARRRLRQLRLDRPELFETDRAPAGALLSLVGEAR